MILLASKFPSELRGSSEGISGEPEEVIIYLAKCNNIFNFRIYINQVKNMVLKEAERSAGCHFSKESEKE